MSHVSINFAYYYECDLQIDLSKPLDAQGPFHGILHKLTDFIAKAELGDKEVVQINKYIYTCI